MRYFTDNENVFTLDDLKYEYNSFIETTPEGDAYQDMPFEDWIREITEEEYNNWKKEE